MASKVKLQLIVDDKGTVEVKQFGNETQRTGKKVRTSSRSMSKDFDTLGKKVNAVHNKMKRMAGIAIAAGAASMTLLVKKTVDAGDNFQKMSLRTGVATETLSAMSHVADLAGTNIGALEMGIRIMSRRMSDANEGLAEAERSFENIGVSIYSADGRLKEFSEIFPEVIKGINSLATDTEKMAMAQELFGRSGTQLLPVIKQGSDAIREQMEEAKKLGIVWRPEDADAAAKLKDNMSRLSSGLAGVRNNLLNAIVPQLSEYLEGLTDKIKELIASGKLKEWGEKAASGLSAFFDKAKSGIDWLVDNKHWIEAAFPVALMVLAGTELLNLAVAVKTLGLSIKTVIALGGIGAIILGGTALIALINKTKNEIIGLNNAVQGTHDRMMASKAVSVEWHKAIKGGLDLTKKEFEELIPAFEKAVKDDEFKGSFVDWFKTLGEDTADEMNKSFTQQVIKGIDMSGFQTALEQDLADMALTLKIGQIDMQPVDIGEIPDVDLGTQMSVQEESWNMVVGHIQDAIDKTGEFSQLLQENGVYAEDIAHAFSYSFDAMFSEVNTQFNQFWDRTFGRGKTTAEKIGQAFLRSMASALVDIMARFAASWLFNLIAPGSGSLLRAAGIFHTGGSVDWQGGSRLVNATEKLHSGGLKSTEMLGKLEIGEYVVQKDSVNPQTKPFIQYVNEKGRVPAFIPKYHHGGPVSNNQYQSYQLSNATNINIQRAPMNVSGVDEETSRMISQAARDSDDELARRIEGLIRSRQLDPTETV